MVLDNKRAVKIVFSGFDEVQTALLAIGDEIKEPELRMHVQGLLYTFISDVLVKFIDARKDDLMEAQKKEQELLLKRITQLEGLLGEEK